MTYEQAKILKKGDGVIYTPFHGSGYPEEVKFVCLDFHQENQEIIVICLDSHDSHRWGYLHQFTLFPSEF